MGIAQYNRGTEVIRRGIRMEQRSTTMRLFDELTAHSLNCNGAVLFGPTVIRIDEDRAGVFLMNKEGDGWASSCYHYSNLWMAVAAWRVAVTGIGKDSAGFYYRVEPIQEVG